MENSWQIQTLFASCIRPLYSQRPLCGTADSVRISSRSTKAEPIRWYLSADTKHSCLLLPTLQLRSLCSTRQSWPCANARLTMAESDFRRFAKYRDISHDITSRPRERMMDAHQMIAAAALHCSVSTTSPMAALVSGSLPARQGCRSRGREFTLSPRHARNGNARLRKETSGSLQGRRYLRITEYD